MQASRVYLDARNEIFLDFLSQNNPHDYKQEINGYYLFKAQCLCDQTRMLFS